MDYHLLLTNTAFTATVVAFVSAIGGWLAARVQKAPDVQTSITGAVASIMKHYQEALHVSGAQTEALRAEIKALHQTVDAQTETITRLETTVDGQSATIASLETHIDELTALMKAAGVTPPPRRKREPA